MAQGETSREEELLAELECRFAAIGRPQETDLLLKIAEAWAVVMAAGFGARSALRSLYAQFPEVDKLLRVERGIEIDTAPDPALVAPWDPTMLEPYGWRKSPVDDEGSAMVPFEVYNGLEETLPWCEGDLFNWKFAASWALNSGWHEAADWIEDHVGEYLLGVYQGFDIE